MIGVVELILGSGLLVAGRKLFWLLVGGIGFAAGVAFATRFVHRSELLTLVAALAAGAIFALIAVFLESIAIGLAGFAGGGLIGAYLTNLLGAEAGALSWIGFIVGGIVGVGLIMVLFDWALISISSLLGASMILKGLGAGQGSAPLAFLGLFVLGVLLQGFAFGAEKSAGTRPVR